MVDDGHDSFFVFFVFTFLLVVGCVDGGWVIIRNEASVSELICERFCSANEVVKVLEFGTDSFNAEMSASFAFCLCLWRFDQWDERIVLRDGVRYSLRWRCSIVIPVWVSVVTE